MTSLTGAYAEACEQAGVEMDSGLLGDILLLLSDDSG
jgi:hypothetical protein